MKRPESPTSQIFLRDYVHIIPWTFERLHPGWYHITAAQKNTLATMIMIGLVSACRDAL